MFVPKQLKGRKTSSTGIFLFVHQKEILRKLDKFCKRYLGLPYVHAPKKKEKYDDGSSVIGCDLRIFWLCPFCPVETDALINRTSDTIDNIVFQVGEGMLDAKTWKNVLFVTIPVCSLLIDDNTGSSFTLSPSGEVKPHDGRESSGGYVVDAIFDNIFRLYAAGTRNINGYVLRRHLKSTESKSSIIAAQKSCAVRAIYKSSPRVTVNDISVSLTRKRLAEKTAEVIPDSVLSSADSVIGVPATGLQYARHIGAKTGITVTDAVSKIKKSQRTFELSSSDYRRRILVANFEIKPAQVRGKNILLVDEAVFTGITLKAVIEKIRESGAEAIHVVIPSPPVSGTCKYLMHAHNNLLSEKIVECRFASYLGADTFTCLPIDVFEAELNQKKTPCIECFRKER